MTTPATSTGSSRAYVATLESRSRPSASGPARREGRGGSDFASSSTARTGSRGPGARSRFSWRAQGRSRGERNPDGSRMLSSTSAYGLALRCGSERHPGRRWIRKSGTERRPRPPADSDAEVSTGSCAVPELSARGTPGGYADPEMSTGRGGRTDSDAEVSTASYAVPKVSARGTAARRTRRRHPTGRAARTRRRSSRPRSASRLRAPSG